VHIHAARCRLALQQIEQDVLELLDKYRFAPWTQKGKKNMPLIQVIVTLIVVGVLLWLVNRFIPMAGSIKSILNAVVVIAVVLWLLNIFGLLQSLTNIHIGKT